MDLTLELCHKLSSYFYLRYGVAPCKEKNHNSDWVIVVFNVKWAISQLYHGKIKLHLMKWRCLLYTIFASQGLPFSPPLADLEYILRIRALIFHWLRLQVHVSNQKTLYTEHMLSTKCKQRWHRNALIWQRFATSRFGSNENIFPVCQRFETFTWLTVSASKLNYHK